MKCQKNFLFLLFERNSELGWQKKKSEQKKKGTTSPRRLDSTRRPPILYLIKLFTFLSKFLPFSPSFNLQKLFLMFSTSTIYPKDILRKQFSQKKVFLKKKKIKKNYSFFFFSNFFFFSLSKTYSTPFSFYFIVIHLLPKKTKRSKKRFA